MNADLHIRMDNVTFSKGGSRILGPISFESYERRIGIVGQNGSGKSSFARVLAGLQKPDTGQVLVNDADTYRDRKAALANIGMIFQNPDHQIIFPTVLEEMVFGLTQTGAGKSDAEKTARDVLAQNKRSDWADRNTHTLSQGQRHYLCLMAVLAMKPGLIILDEPYAGLDIPTSISLHRKLDEAKQSLVLITHDPAALKGFDRVLWLDKGAIREDGAAAPVLDAFVTEMTRLGEGAC